MKEGGFFVSEECRELTREAEKYRLEDRPDGVFQPVKEQDHGMDAMRYAFTRRPWYAQPGEQYDHDDYQHGTAPSGQFLDWLVDQQPLQ
jgi:hypothetical protein